jgi:hypothetical protein
MDKVAGRVKLVERLPYTPPLLPDELLSSWIARIEAYYLMHGALRRWLVQDVVENPDQPLTGNVAGLLDIAPTNAMLVRLGTLTGVAPDDLQSRTLLAVYPGLQADDFAQSHCSVAGIPASRSVFCQECARDMLSSPTGQYLRAEWALLWQTICPRHLVPLNDLWTRCGQCEEFSPTLSSDGTAQLICQACRGDLFDLEYGGAPSRCRPRREDDTRVLGSRFEQSTLQALATGKGDGPWLGSRSPQQVRNVLRWFADFTGQLERDPDKGTAPMLRRMSPRLLPSVARRQEPITRASLPFETVLTRRQLIFTLWFLLATPRVKGLLDPPRRELIAMGLLKPETSTEWLLNVAEAAIAQIPRDTLARFAPYPRLLVAGAQSRYRRKPRPFDERYANRAVGIPLERPQFWSPPRPSSPPPGDWMSEEERRNLVDRYLQSEEGKRLRRLSPTEARRALGRVARVLYEQHWAKQQT